MNDAERQYAAQQAAYARSQVMASPAAYVSPIATQSPSAFEVGVNGFPTRHGGTAAKSLSIDVVDNGTPAADVTPASASSSGKRKTSGKKAPGATGGKKKGGKGVQDTRGKVEKSDDFTIPSTPTQAGGHGGELQYGQTQSLDYAGSHIMSRSGTS